MLRLIGPGPVRTRLLGGAQSGVALAALVCAVSGCVLEPFRGEQFDDLGDPMQLSGFIPEPLNVFQDIQVSALSGATGAFERLSAPVELDRNLVTSVYFGERWSAWETRVQLASEYWLPGASGFRAVLRVTAGGSPATFFGEGLANCAPRFLGGSLAEMLDGCGAPGAPLTVCTQDYVHPGARRGPCPSRLLDVRPAGGESRRVYPGDGTETLALEGAPGTFALRGDSASFVDVFDSPVDSPAPGAFSVGVSRGSFVRLFYRGEKASNESESFDWGSIRAGVPAGLSLGLPQTLRFYDRGECSARVSLEQLLPRVESVMLRALQPLVAAGSGQLERTTLVPVLRVGADALAARLRLRVTVPSPSAVAGTHRLVIGVQAGLSQFAETLEFEREHFSVRVPDGVEAEAVFAGLGLPPQAQTEADLQEAFWREGGFELDEFLGGLPLAGVPLQRVFLTPEGLELVVVDDPESPLLEALEGLEPSLCARELSPVAVQYGAFEAPVREAPAGTLVAGG